MRNTRSVPPRSSDHASSPLIESLHLIDQGVRKHATDTTIDEILNPGDRGRHKLEYCLPTPSSMSKTFPPLKSEPVTNKGWLLSATFRGSRNITIIPTKISLDFRLKKRGWKCNQRLPDGLLPVWYMMTFNLGEGAQQVFCVSSVGILWNSAAHVRILSATSWHCSAVRTILLGTQESSNSKPRRSNILKCKESKL